MLRLDRGVLSEAAHRLDMVISAAALAVTVLLMEVEPKRGPVCVLLHQIRVSVPLVIFLLRQALLLAQVKVEACSRARYRPTSWDRQISRLHGASGLDQLHLEIVWPLQLWGRAIHVGHL